MDVFAADIRQFNTALDLEKHLTQYDRDVAGWVTGATLHHTWKPLASQWRGRSTLMAMMKFFTNVRGWDRGPHLFIAPDGIWQLTPLNIPGIHAVSTNKCHWGIEVVGNYDKEDWPEKTKEMVYDTIFTLFAWRGITVNERNLVGHRETGSPKTCPGSAIDMNQVRKDLKQRQMIL
jgi:hypothetical protein